MYCNRMHSDAKKRRSFLALLFAAVDVRHSLVEMAIEKDEKTALQWLKKQAIKIRGII